MAEQHVYSAGVFEVSNIDQAKAIILTPEGGSTQERWEKETPAVVDLISRQATLTTDSLVIDYGCGIGRVAKELIAKFGCKVIGVDISHSMRALAAAYVAHPHFLACAPEFLPHLGVQADLAISVWVLQHCLRPQEDIGRIYDAVKQDGQFFVVNNLCRAVPTIDKLWVNDGLDIDALVCADFDGGERGHLPQEVCPSGLSELTYWRVYRKT